MAHRLRLVIAIAAILVTVPGAVAATTHAASRLHSSGPWYPCQRDGSCPTQYGSGFDFCDTFGGHAADTGNAWYAPPDSGSASGVYACEGPQTSASPFDSVTDPPWQCVELVERYLWTFFNMFTRPDSGYQVVESIHQAYGVPIGKPTTPRNRPYPGDIVSLAEGTGGDGHTAIVTAVKLQEGKDGGHGTITVLQQNFPIGHGGLGTIKINKDWSETEGGEKVSGWLNLEGGGGAESENVHSISCPNSSYCLAVGQYSNLPVAHRWQDGSWVQLAPPKVPWTPTNLEGVSCVSTARCTAVGSYSDRQGQSHGIVYSLNGTAWIRAKLKAPDSWKDWGLSAIACTGPTECMALGWYQPYEPPDANPPFTLPTSFHLESGKWVIRRIPGPSKGQQPLIWQLDSIGCASRTICVAVGEWGDGGSKATLTDVWSHGEWTRTASPNGQGTYNGLNDVSCGDPNTCLAVGQSDNRPLRLLWKDSKWTKLKVLSYDPNTTSFAVSCPDAHWCMVLGDTQAETWKDGKWRIVGLAGPLLSCPSRSLCISFGRLWDGSRWVLLPV